VDAATYVALTSVGTRPYVCVEMNYFAYGSNLNTDHLRSWLTRWGVDPEELGPRSEGQSSPATACGPITCVPMESEPATSSPAHGAGSRGSS
jgi:hypothetical protein